jgi:hypothetical protein
VNKKRLGVRHTFRALLALSSAWLSPQISSALSTQQPISALAVFGSLTLEGSDIARSDEIADRRDPRIDSIAFSWGKSKCTPIKSWCLLKVTQDPGVVWCPQCAKR